MQELSCTFNLLSAQQIATAALPALMRFGSGALGAGYSISFPPAEKGTYAVAEIAGRAIKETSKASTFNRPAKPLELYEFEGCPFCRKVGLHRLVL